MKAPQSRPAITESTDWKVLKAIDAGVYKLSRQEKWSGLGQLIRSDRPWGQRDAYYILSGLHPSSDLSDTQTRIVWLGERPLRWEGLSRAQIRRRLFWQFDILQKRLWGLNSPMPSRYWILCAIERGVAPVWLPVIDGFAKRAAKQKKARGESATLSEGDIGFYLPARFPLSTVRLNKEKAAIRRDWERWVLRERGFKFKSKIAFFEHVSEKYEHFDKELLLKWLSQWESETCVTYGALDPDGPIGGDGLPAERGYNWLADLAALRNPKASPPLPATKKNLETIRRIIRSGKKPSPSL